MAPESIRLARLLVSGVASTLDFSLEELEDVAIAVDELCYLLIGPEPSNGTVRLSCVVESAGLCVEGSAPDRGQPDAPSAFSASILSATVDSSEVWRDQGTIRFRFVRASRAAPPGA
jgi:anti-sigma regulatory factor (Ser/Thr protein kinase)